MYVSSDISMASIVKQYDVQDVIKVCTMYRKHNCALLRVDSGVLDCGRIPCGN